MAGEGQVSISREVAAAAAADVRDEGATFDFNFVVVVKAPL